MQTLPWSQASIASTWGQSLVASQMKHSRIGCLYVGFLIQIIISLLVTSTIKTKANLSQTFFYYFPLPLFIPSCNMYLKNLWLIQYCLLMCPFQRIFQHFFFPKKKAMTSTARPWHLPFVFNFLDFNCEELQMPWMDCGSFGPQVGRCWGFRWSDVGVIKVKVYHSCWWILISYICRILWGVCVSHLYLYMQCLINIWHMLWYRGQNW